MKTIGTNRSSGLFVSIDVLRGDDDIQSAVTKPGSDGGKHGADDEGDVIKHRSLMRND